MKTLNLVITIILSMLLTPFFYCFATAQDSVSIIMYHRFGESNYPSTSIQLDKFKEHLEELKNPKYKVMHLSRIIEDIKAGRELPEFTVAITIDDAFMSVYKEGWPLLKEYNFPFTIFVATDPIDQGLNGYMNWDQLRELRSNGVEIGSQTKSHPHMHRLSEDEIRNEINYSNNRFKQELNEIPKLFAYPYGEYNLTAKKVAEETFEASFGQHSGSAHPSLGFHELPRFAMNEAYGSLERLVEAANTLPFIVSEIYPEDPVIKENPPSYGFTLKKEYGQIDQLQCFISGIGEADVTVIGRRVEVRSEKKFYRPRHRINCTMPGENRRWHWLGRQFLLN